MKIPSFQEFIGEGILTNYRNERENMKITYSQMEDSFEDVLKKLIEEKIPFYFDCTYKNYQRIGYLMNETINNVNFNGFILDDSKSYDDTCSDLNNILKDTVIDKSTNKLHIGRTNFSDLTKANDLDTICVVTKAFKSYLKEKGNTLGDQKRVITGNKYEVNVSIEFLCDKSKVHDLIDFIF